MSRVILEAEVARLAAKVPTYGQDVVWKQNEFSEILPFPTPLSLSLVRRLARHDGATGTVCRQLGLTYDPAIAVEDYLETVFGRLMVNASAEALLTGAGTIPSFLKRLRAATSIRREMTLSYLGFGETAAELEAYFQRHCAEDLTTLPEAALLSRVGFLVDTLTVHYQSVVKAGLLARFSLDELVDLCGHETLSPLLALSGQALPDCDPFARRIFAFREKELARLSGYGAEVDYELACPRFLEKGPAPPQLPVRTFEAAASAAIGPRIKGPLVHFKIYESLKTIFKALLLREIHLLRLTLLEYDRRQSATGDVFYLGVDELLSPDDRGRGEKIAQRRGEEAVFAPLHIPAMVRLSDLPDLARGFLTTTPHPLKGVSVNGFAFSGEALLCTGNSDLECAEPTHILVVKYARPDLVSCFGRVRGIVTETGGMLSHLAIVAREQGFPLVIQALDATSLVADGTYLDVGADGTITPRQ